MRQVNNKPPFVSLAFAVYHLLFCVEFAAEHPCPPHSQHACIVLSVPCEHSGGTLLGLAWFLSSKVAGFLGSMPTGYQTFFLSFFCLLTFLLASFLAIQYSFRLLNQKLNYHFCMLPLCPRPIARGVW